MYQLKKMYLRLISVNKKWMRKIKLISVGILCSFIILLVGACKKASSSAEVTVQGTSKYTDVPGIKPGWDIYPGGGYRYGPSIIINADGSIDAWFATPGDFFGDRVKNYNDPDDQTPIPMSSGVTAAQKFSTAESFYAIQVRCPSWGSTTASLTLSLFHWNADYNTTIAGTAMATILYKNYGDNQSLEIKNENKFPPGDYLWLLSNPSGTAGVWEKNSDKTGVVNYLNGGVVSGSYAGWMLVNKSTGASYWDQIAYRHSTDGGVSWTADQMVVKPTEYSRDQLSCCDPGVAKWGGYYYLGYTSTEDTRGTDNHAYVCRSQTPVGPWEKWNGSGWGGLPEPVITYTGDKDLFGAGEPSMVVKGDTVFFYYSWNAGGTEAVTTRLSTASAKDVNWPAHLKDYGTVINKTSIDGADHCDIKYRDDIKKFQAIHTASRMTATSYIVLWESADGIVFKKIAELRNNLNPYLHNCGWSGNETGHINPEKQQYISYAYGPNWGNWKTAWHPLTFKP